MSDLKKKRIGMFNIYVYLFFPDDLSITNHVIDLYQIYYNESYHNLIFKLNMRIKHLYDQAYYLKPIMPFNIEVSFSHYHPSIDILPFSLEDSKENQEKQINTTQTFKSDECVICITNPSNILFCNCGHIAICVECDEVKSLLECPVCKTENTIKRMVEY